MTEPAECPGWYAQTPCELGSPFTSGHGFIHLRDPPMSATASTLRNTGTRPPSSSHFVLITPMALDCPWELVEGSCWAEGSSPAEGKNPQNTQTQSFMGNCGQLDLYVPEVSQMPGPHPGEATRLVEREAGDILPASVWLWSPSSLPPSHQLLNGEH